MHVFETLSPASCSTSEWALRSRHAFTLVELLVVIVIIGILIALLVPAIGNVLYTSRNAQMGIELSNLAQSIEAYRMEVGDYPPDFALVPTGMDTAQLNKHLARKFRYRSPQDNVPMIGLDPSEALVFWLGGFSADAKFPLSKRDALGGAPIKGSKPFFEFDQTRLDDKDGDGYPEYYPESSEMPYVYLKHDNYGVLNDSVFVAASHRILSSPDIPKGVTQVRAYAAELTGIQVKRFVEAEKFQILCAGQDGDFGAGMMLAEGLAPAYPDAVGYAEADEDNIANFSEGKTLQDAVP